MEKIIALTAACGALGGLTMLLVGYLFLVVSAFGRHAAWGISLILFLPVSVIFSIKHWEYANYGAKLCLKGIAVLVSCGLVFFYVVTGNKDSNSTDVSSAIFYEAQSKAIT